MKIVTLAGAHACGKTAVILKTAELLKARGLRCGVVKSDCLYSDEEQAYVAAGLRHRKLLARNVCPDHHFASSLLDIFSWGKEEGLDVLFTESAGLCGRCAPHIRGVAAVCVIDCLSGISAPKKAGPMLRGSGRIVLISTHDPVLALSCEKRITLKNGAVTSIRVRSGREEALLRELRAADERLQSIRETIRGGGAL